ncbi:MAG: hypothetical protein ACM3JC_09010 [Rudaea sp.]
MLDLLEYKPPRTELLATSTDIDEWLRAGADGACHASVDELMNAIERRGCDMRFVPDWFCPVIDAM